jgi:hypothetical protein
LFKQMLIYPKSCIPLEGTSTPSGSISTWGQYKNNARFQNTLRKGILKLITQRKQFLVQNCEPINL